MSLFIIAFILSFLFFHFVAGKHACDHPTRAVVFQIRDYRIHIHHWIIAAVLLIICYVVRVDNLFVLGLICGAIAQGLTYRDRFVIVYHEKYYEQICKKWGFER